MKKVSISKSEKHRIFAYTMVGAITTIMNIGLFEGLCYIGIEYKTSNLITLILVKLAAYVGNKYWVFDSKCNSYLETILEFLRFMFWRLATMLIDFVGLIVLVEVFYVDAFFSKCFVTLLVIVVNYFASKYSVFKKTV